jgi:agmatine deiminase
MINIKAPTPSDMGYFFPAEWAPHRATWLSWIHKEASWPGKIESAYPAYCELIVRLAKFEQVCINVTDARMEADAINILRPYTTDFNNIKFYHHPTNDAWCRDHGPAFLLSKEGKRKMIVDWGYNAWGNKYPPYDLDDDVPTLVGKALGLEVVYPNIVVEGGSVDFNGKGTLLTTKQCLLNENRNPHLTQKDIEQYLEHFYGVHNIIWLGDGIEGDDTDGHIDDITRFVNEHTIVTVVEADKQDANHEPLAENLKLLKTIRLEDGKQPTIVELPMPKPVIWEDQRLPASYANFYIANKQVIVPTFRDKNDDVALQLLQSVFPKREVVGIDSWDLIWGLGSFHCLTQQEPIDVFDN